MYKAPIKRTSIALKISSAEEKSRALIYFSVFNICSSDHFFYLLIFMLNILLITKTL